MPSNCTIISWKGKKEMASLLKGSKGGAFQYSRRGLRLRRRGAYGIHRASGPMDAKGCVERLHRFAQGAADWRSGPRWSILSVLCPVHPFATTWHFPSRGNEKIGGTGYCVTYDTDSQSRNVLASPLGEEGHEVAKGCTRVRMIMILDVDVTAERRHYNTHRPLKGKRLTTFCASLALLQNVFAVHRKGDTTTLGPKGRQT